jgi:hypothetical protein
VDIENDLGTRRGGFKYSEAVEATVAPSSAVATGLLAACAATLGVLLATPWDAELRLALALLAGVAFADALRVVAWRRGPRAVAHFRVALDRTVRVRDASGREREGVLRDPGFVAPWLTIVRWRPDSAWLDRTFLVVPGMLEAEAFRRLRVLLRYN